MSKDAEVDAEGYPKTCGCCGQPTKLTPDITVMVIFVPALKKPYPLIPACPYRVCARAGCDSSWRFVTRAAEAHEATRNGGTWTRAIIVFSTGEGADLKNEITDLEQTPLFGGPVNGAKA